MTAEPRPTFNDFCDRLRGVNPFLVNRVDRPLADLADVPAIHEAGSNQILALGRQAREENRGVGVVVWGEAGVGKSHLLARLGGWAANGDACSAYLHNLQASPERLPRNVLKAVVSTLTRPPLRNCQLFRLLNAALKKAVPAGGPTPPSWSQVGTAYRRLVADLAASDPSGGVLFDRTVHEVLFRFFHGAHSQGGNEALAALAVRWLSGDALEPAEAGQLGLPLQAGAGPVALADNQHVKQVLVALTQLARAAGRLFLLLFDQVDNLDAEQVRALSRFLHDLLDSAGNLLIVTAGVQQTLLGFLQRGVITETSWDRVGQFEFALGRLRQDQGREVLWERLEKFFMRFRDITEIKERLRADPLFPLGTAWFERRLRDLADFRPRDLIGWACLRWQQQQERLAAMSPELWLRHWQEEAAPPRPRDTSPEEITAAIDRRLEEQLAEQRRRCEQDAALRVPDEDRFLGLVEGLLQTCLAGGRPYRLEQCQRVPLPRTGARGPYDLLLDQRTAGGALVRVGVRVLVTDTARTAFAALTRLTEDPAPPNRTLLLTDKRQPLPLGSKGRACLNRLQQRGAEGFRHLEVPPDEYFALEALHAVIGLARSGDLEVLLPSGERRPLTPAEVIASHHRRNRYLSQRVLAELLGGLRDEAPPPANTAPPPPVNETDARQFIMAQVGIRERVSLDELSRIYAEQHGGPAPDVRGYRAQLGPIAGRLSETGLIRTLHEANGPVFILAATAPHPAAP